MNTWSLEEVGVWLAGSGFEKYVDYFAKEQIDGQSLSSLSESDINELLAMGSEAKATIGIKSKFRAQLDLIRNFAPKDGDIEELSRFLEEQASQSSIQPSSPTRSASLVCGLSTTPKRDREAVDNFADTEEYSIPGTILRERRRCLSPHALVMRKREVYGHESAGRPLKVMKMDKAGRKPYLRNENEQPIDDLMMIEQHRLEMKQLIVSNYDISLFKFKFDITYSHRRQMIRKNELVKNMIESYPGLTILSLVRYMLSLVKDAQRSTFPYQDDFMKGIQLRFKQLANGIGGKLSLALQKEKIDEEPKRLLFNREPLTPFPTLSTEIMNNSRNYTLFVEGVKLFTTDNQCAAVAGFLATYEVFNLSYSNNIRDTLHTLNGLVFKTRDFDLCRGAQRFLHSVSSKNFRLLVAGENKSENVDAKKRFLACYQ
ncbi:unnamed protein product [Didymodactylos carnosus]|uniref:SAM domain-containing protein n=1 Tax=Didymodactylos carnosus TaxID=1234261 RepID=A0A8S2R3N4_9BILA|nr:unnamed protein product [Didymodactylos carnosus]CAF4136898.1 unnamed protein product [Didymodactylos carnosus]